MIARLAARRLTLGARSKYRIKFFTLNMERRGLKSTLLAPVRQSIRKNSDWKAAIENAPAGTVAEG